VIVELHNVRAMVLDATDAEHEWLGEYLSWPDEAAHFRRRHGYRGDGYVRLYNRADDTYPAGFTRMLVTEARKRGHAVEVRDARVVPATPAPPAAGLGWLRDYQLGAVDASIKRTRGVVHAATGAGKTEIIAGIVESVPTNWLLLVHRTQLGLQARDRYRLRTGVEAGVVAEGEWSPDHGPHGLTVATFQSLHAALKVDADGSVRAWLATIGGLAVDECHTLPADTFRAVVDHTVNAYWRIGVSGTPLARGDRKAMHLIGCLGSVLYRVSARQLIEAGLLARPRIRMVVHECTSDKKTWQGAYNDIVAGGKTRNRLVVDLVVRAAKPCVVFTKALKQGRVITKMIQRAGLQVEYVDGSTPTASRQLAVKRLERGDVDVLVASVVMNEGIDIPELRSVVMAAGGSSTIAALQRVGRGMRVVPGKTEFEVWDVDDQGNKWTERHSAERVRAYEVEEYEVARAVVNPDGSLTEEPYA
jgi:superfamily II DNA or RNA helicase